MIKTLSTRTRGCASCALTSAVSFGSGRRCVTSPGCENPLRAMAEKQNKTKHLLFFLFLLSPPLFFFLKYRFFVLFCFVLFCFVFFFSNTKNNLRILEKCHCKTLIQNVVYALKTNKQTKKQKQKKTTTATMRFTNDKRVHTLFSLYGPMTSLIWYLVKIDSSSYNYF